jgi:hypothetical protein
MHLSPATKEPSKKAVAMSAAGTPILDNRSRPDGHVNYLFVRVSVDIPDHGAGASPPELDSNRLVPAHETAPNEERIGIPAGNKVLNGSAGGPGPKLVRR